MTIEELKSIGFKNIGSDTWLQFPLNSGANIWCNGHTVELERHHQMIELGSNFDINTLERLSSLLNEVFN